MDLFPIPLLKEKINLDCASITKEILEAKALTTNYTSYFEEDTFLIESSSAIKQIILEHANKFFPTISDRNIIFNEENINIWWNVYKEGDHHCFHDHGRSLLSGTIYVNIDESSSPIEFESPLDGLIRTWASDDLKDRWKQSETFGFPAIKNNIIMTWPPWLKHSVPAQGKTDNPRITISFNLDKRQ